MSAIGSFLKGLEGGLIKTGNAVEEGVAVGAFFGPPAAGAASSFVNWVVAAEKRHVAAKAGTPLGVDTRKQEVIDDVKNGEPMIRALLALAGHAPTNDAAFDQFVSCAIDATVQGLNAYAAFNLAFAPVPVPIK